jgi:Flp pilus assembly pilin Flp
MRNAGKFLTRFWSDEEGAVGTEYGVLLVIIALGMAIAASLLGQEISNALGRGANCLAAGPNCVP